jgi:polyphosphate glucokinase
MVVDDKGKPLTGRLRTPTPKPATPVNILRVIRKMAGKAGEFDKVSVGFPGVIHAGKTATAHNLHKRWIGFDLGKALRLALKKSVRVCNDADVQGLAVVDGKGVELVLTLGTGVGSALFVDGKLVPNLELAHHPFRGKDTYEQRLGVAALKEDGKKKWNRNLSRALEELDEMFNYDRVWIGGGNTDAIMLKLDEKTKIVPNVAGLTGGAKLWI